MSGAQLDIGHQTLHLLLGQTKIFLCCCLVSNNRFLLYRSRQQDSDTNGAYQTDEYSLFYLLSYIGVLA